MKNFIIASLLSASALCSIINHADIYPETARVYEIENDTVTVETFNGNLFAFEGAEDYEIGDYVSMIMSGNHTESVVDDEILKVKYAG